MTLTDSNFYRHRNTQETHKSSDTNEAAHDHGMGAITHFHQKESVVPFSRGVLLTGRNSGSGLQVKTILPDLECVGSNSVTSYKGRNVSCFSLLRLATTPGSRELFIFLLEGEKTLMSFKLHLKQVI